MYILQLHPSALTVNCAQNRTEVGKRSISGPYLGFVQILNTTYEQWENGLKQHEICSQNAAYLSSHFWHWGPAWFHLWVCEVILCPHLPSVWRNISTTVTHNISISHFSRQEIKRCSLWCKRELTHLINVSFLPSDKSTTSSWVSRWNQMSACSVWNVNCLKYFNSVTRLVTHLGLVSGLICETFLNTQQVWCGCHDDVD